MEKSCGVLSYLEDNMYGNLFKSKEEREKEYNEYKNKMFPLGESQKDLAVSLLNSLISKKSFSNYALFYFLVSKEKYMEKGDDAINTLQKYIMMRNTFNIEEANMIISSAILDLKTASLDDYPTKEEVLEKVKSIKK